MKEIENVTEIEKGIETMTENGILIIARIIEIEVKMMTDPKTSLCTFLD